MKSTDKKTHIVLLPVTHRRTPTSHVDAIGVTISICTPRNSRNTSLTAWPIAPLSSSSLLLRLLSFHFPPSVLPVLFDASYILYDECRWETLVWQIAFRLLSSKSAFRVWFIAFLFVRIAPCWKVIPSIEQRDLFSFSFYVFLLRVCPCIRARITG